MEKQQTSIPDIPLDLVTNDYKGYFEMMKEAIPVLTPEWTDTSDTDQGIVILQLLSYGLHILGYYQERALQENILEFARTKKGILTGSKFIGYIPARQSASTVTLTINKDSDFLGTEKIVPKGSKFSTNPNIDNPIIFETVSDLTIPAGELTGKVVAVQGETIESEVIGTSNGRANQTFLINTPDVLVDSMTVYTSENGVLREWEMKEHFLDSGHNDRHYTIDRDEEDRTLIKFGDGVSGRKPNNEEPVYLTCRYGGGKFGDLSPNMINYVYEEDYDLNFIDTVYNEEFATGGKDYEDMNDVKVKAPKNYRSRGQAVTPLDFEDIAELTEGVGKAKCIETFVTATVYLYLLSDKYELPTESLCSRVKEKVDSNRVGSVDLEVLPCKITEFDIELDVLVSEGFDKVKVKEAVSKNLAEHFHVSNFKFNEPFYASKVVEIAFKTAGVKNVTINSDVTTDLVCEEEFEILKLKEVKVTAGGM